MGRAVCNFIASFVVVLGFQTALGGDKFILPDVMSVQEKYSHLDPSGAVPPAALQRLVLYYDQVKSSLGNPYYATVIDFSVHSSKKRMHVINMKTGAVVSYLASHGRGSESGRNDDDGYANKFSNVSGSNASSLGMYKTVNEYQGSNGISMRLQGLEKSNSNAMSRAIVVHGADYVSPSVIQSTGRIGRSQGCPAVERRFIKGLIKTLKGGSLMLGWFDR